jgi:hypothetical protein
MNCVGATTDDRGRTHARGFQPIPSVTEKCYFVRAFPPHCSPTTPRSTDRFRPVRDKM